MFDTFANPTTTARAPSLRELRSLMDSLPKAPPRTILVVPKGTKLPFAESVQAESAGDGLLGNLLNGIQIVESEFVDAPKMLPLPEPADYFKVMPEPIYQPEVPTMRFRTRFAEPIWPLASYNMVLLTDGGSSYYRPPARDRRHRRTVDRIKRFKKLQKRCVYILKLFSAGKLRSRQPLRKVANFLEHNGHHDTAKKCRQLMEGI